MGNSRFEGFTKEEIKLAYEFDMLNKSMVMAGQNVHALQKQLYRLSAPQKLLNKMGRNALVEIKDTMIRSAPASICAGLAGAAAAPGGPAISFLASAAAGSIGGELAKPITSRTGVHTQLYPTCANNTTKDIEREVMGKLQDKLSGYPRLHELYRTYVNKEYAQDFVLDTALANTPDVITSSITEGVSNWTAGTFSSMLQYGSIPVSSKLVFGLTAAAGLDPRGIYNKGKDTFRAMANMKPGPHAGGNYLEQNLLRARDCLSQLIASLNNNPDRKLNVSAFMNKFPDLALSHSKARETSKDIISMLELLIMLEKERENEVVKET
ncbi:MULTISPECIES: hypothetical protein [Photorhabdus]|uniref:Uncharacterized protein n=1 Tax=Photorhabdus thracensis TaxID=230089 RepID=A0A0F7LTR0_9GAMM|nr:hypothetical protein [Photorhabdus thracensis]AKH65286.1 hypothetical protein VY86_19970 [Photorhabdus thracensis]MCC8421576.1 hypothetical protein [Photorhabdus thracensis]